MILETRQGRFRNSRGRQVFAPVRSGQHQSSKIEALFGPDDQSTRLAARIAQYRAESICCEGEPGWDFLIMADTVLYQKP